MESDACIVSLMKEYHLCDLIYAMILALDIADDVGNPLGKIGQILSLFIFFFKYLFKKYVV